MDYKRISIGSRRFWEGIGQFGPKFLVKGDVPPPTVLHVARLVRPMNALQLCRWQFSHKDLCSRLFFKRSAILDGNRPFCVFETHLGDLRAIYDDHLRLIGKRILDFLLVLIKLFFARCYGWEATGEYRLKIGDFAPTGASWPKISGRRGRPHQPFFFSKKLD